MLPVVLPALRGAPKSSLSLRLGRVPVAMAEGLPTDCGQLSRVSVSEWGDINLAYKKKELIIWVSVRSADLLQ